MIAPEWGRDTELTKAQRKIATMILDDFEDWFLQEGVDHWAVSPDGTCHYETFDGRHCAVGRWMLADRVGSAAGSIWRLENTVGGLDSWLRPEARGLPPGFWACLQQVHDRLALYQDDDHEQESAWTLLRVIKEAIA